MKRALYGTRMASRRFWKFVGKVLKDAQFEAVTIVPNTYNHPQRDIDTVVHGDDFVAVAEDDHLNLFETVLEFSIGDQASREDWSQALERWKGAQTCRQLKWRWTHLGGNCWESW